MKSLSVHPIIKQCYKREIFLLFACRYMKSPYLCIVFFIVLDLRLTKVGVQRYSFFYAHTFTSSSQPAFTSLFLRSGIHSGFLSLPGSKPDDAKISGRRCHKIVRSLKLNYAVVEAESCGRFQPPLHAILKKYYSREKKYFSVCRSTKSPYLCTVFFIVLDLRLTKGWSTAVLLFLCPYFCVHLHQFNHL